MIAFFQRYFLFLCFVLSFLIIGCLFYKRYETIQTLKPYSMETVLLLNENPKNKPLILKLFKWGEEVGPYRDTSSSQILDKNLRHKKILLNRMCKDSCRALRCRMDPGLGHACRINCPQKTIYTCRLSLKLSDIPPS